MNDQTIEQEIQDKGLTAPRITPADIEANIRDEVYFTADQGCEAEESNDPVLSSFDSLKLLTFCVLVLRNGSTVTGKSECASPENFDAELGRKIARQNAVAKVWPPAGLRVAEQAGCCLTPEVTRPTRRALKAPKRDRAARRGGSR